MSRRNKHFRVFTNEADLVYRCRTKINKVMPNGSLWRLDVDAKSFVEVAADSIYFDTQKLQEMMAVCQARNSEDLSGKPVYAYFASSDGGTSLALKAIEPVVQ